ncbi:MAG: AAC(3) family N-acetyltransferase [Sedimenticola sp.]|nr:AAC(3) family N-acetyltransferase [Sedimenticola sp.]
MNNRLSQIKQLIIKYLYSYDSNKFGQKLKKLGISQGDVLFVHGSWIPNSGFRGGPLDMINVLKSTVGKSGIIMMPSMTYHNQSSREFLEAGAIVDLRRTPSKMGILSEVFRRNREVARSKSITHPILVWGEMSQSVIEGQETNKYPFGEGSLFDKLLSLNGKILCINAPFSTITFTHYLEDRISKYLSFPLYEPEPQSGVLIDSLGEKRNVEAFVLSKVANQLRREERLIEELDKKNIIKRSRIGNTQLLLIDCTKMTECVDAMYEQRKSFFDRQSNAS